MRISDAQINSLKKLLHELYGLNYSDEQAQEAGLAIMRFVIAKAQRQQELTNKEIKNGTIIT